MSRRKGPRHDAYSNGAVAAGEFVQLVEMGRQKAEVSAALARLQGTLATLKEQALGGEQLRRVLETSTPAS